MLSKTLECEQSISNFALTSCRSVLPSAVNYLIAEGADTFHAFYAEDLRDGSRGCGGAMTAVAAIAPEAKSREDRRYRRVPVELPGRYLLSDGSEHVCHTIDLSPTGIFIRGPQVGLHGERVIVYIENLGRVEGVVVRRRPGSFALDLRTPGSKRARLAERIEWIQRRSAGAVRENYASERAEVDPLRAVLRTSDGREWPAELMEVSLIGARLSVDARPALGAVVSLGQQTARVAQHLPDGLVVKFELDASDR